MERDYNLQGLEQALDAFTRARELNVIAIHALSASDLERIGMLENSGEIKLGKLLELMREHDSAHIRELGDLVMKLAQLWVKQSS